jgi:hypothetical protein
VGRGGGGDRRVVGRFLSELQPQRCRLRHRRGGRRRVLHQGGRGRNSLASPQPWCPAIGPCTYPRPFPWRRLWRFAAPLQAAPAVWCGVLAAMSIIGAYEPPPETKQLSKTQMNIEYSHPSPNSFQIGPNAQCVTRPPLPSPVRAVIIGFQNTREPCHNVTYAARSAASAASSSASRLRSSSSALQAILIVTHASLRAISAHENPLKIL